MKMEEEVRYGTQRFKDTDVPHMLMTPGALGLERLPKVSRRVAEHKNT